MCNPQSLRFLHLLSEPGHREAHPSSRSNYHPEGSVCRLCRSNHRSLPVVPLKHGTGTVGRNYLLEISPTIAPAKVNEGFFSVVMTCLSILVKNSNSSEMMMIIITLIYQGRSGNSRGNLWGTLVRVRGHFDLYMGFKFLDSAYSERRILN